MQKLLEVQFLEAKFLLEKEVDIPYRKYLKGSRVLIYIAYEHRVLVFYAEEQILDLYEENDLNKNLFLRFKQDAENGKLKFLLHEDNNYLIIE